MAYKHEYPYTDAGRYNSDWLLNKMKDLIVQWADLDERFDTQVEETVRQQLADWDEDGTLDRIINEEIFADLNNQITTLSIRTDDIDSRLVNVENRIIKPSANDTVNIQRAIDTDNIAILSWGNYNIGQIVLKQGSVIIGSGINNTIINSTGEFAFVYETFSNVVVQGISISGLTINASNGGIRINSTTRDVSDSDTANPQSYVMRCVFRELLINAVSDGIQMTKSFDSRIYNCNILNANRGVHLYGCDICTIRDNRFSSNAVSVSLEGTGTFGSQCVVDHNDMLNSSQFFITTSDRQPVIKENYFEDTDGSISHCIYVGSCISCKIIDNRFEISNNSWYYAYIPVNAMSVDIYGNTSQSGINIGRGFDFPAGYKYYWFSYFYYHTMLNIHHNPINNGIPYFNKENDNSDNWLFSPSHFGLSDLDYGKTVEVYNNSFRIPLADDFTQTMRFNKLIGRQYTTVVNISKWTASTSFTERSLIMPTSPNGRIYIANTNGTTGITEPSWGYGNVDDGSVQWRLFDTTLNGVFDVLIKAYSTSGAGKLQVRAQNGISTISAVVVDVISTSDKIYTALENITFEDATIAINNNRGDGGTEDVYLSEIIMVYK